MPDETEKKGGILESFRRAAGEDTAVEPNPGVGGGGSSGSILESFRKAAGEPAKSAPTAAPTKPSGPPEPGPKAEVFGDSQTTDLAEYAPADPGEMRKQLDRLGMPVQFPTEDELIDKALAGMGVNQIQAISERAKFLRKGFRAERVNRAQFEKAKPFLSPEEASILEDRMFGTGYMDQQSAAAFARAAGGSSQRDFDAFKGRLDVATATNALQQIQAQGDKILDTVGEDSEEFQILSDLYADAEKFNPTIETRDTDKGLERIRGGWNLTPEQAASYLEKLQKVTSEIDAETHGGMLVLELLSNAMKGVSWGAIDLQGGDHLWGLAENAGVGVSMFGKEVSFGGQGWEDSLLAADEGAIARYFENKGFGEQIMTGAASLLPAIFNVGALGGALGRGAARYVGAEMGARTGNALAMALYSAGQGEDPIAAGAAGFLEPAIVKYLDGAMSKAIWKMGPKAAQMGLLGRLGNTVSESVGGVLTGVAVHGMPTPDEFTIDAIIGAATGFFGGKSVVVRDLAEIRSKALAATDTKTRARYEKQWTDLYNRTIGAEAEAARKAANEAGKADYEGRYGTKAPDEPVQGPIDDAPKPKAADEAPVEARDRPQEPSVAEPAPQATEPARAQERPTEAPVEAVNRASDARARGDVEFSARDAEQQAAVALSRIPIGKPGLTDGDLGGQRVVVVRDKDGRATAMFSVDADGFADHFYSTSAAASLRALSYAKRKGFKVDIRSAGDDTPQGSRLREKVGEPREFVSDPDLEGLFAEPAPQATEPARAPEKPAVGPEAGAYGEAPLENPMSPRARDFSGGEDYAKAQMDWLRDRAKDATPEQAERLDRAMDEVQGTIDRGQADDAWRADLEFDRRVEARRAEEGAFDPAPEKPAEAPVGPAKAAEGGGKSYAEMMGRKEAPADAPRDSRGEPIPEPAEVLKSEPTAPATRAADGMPEKTSNKNRMVDDDRIARGLDRLEKVAREGQEQVWDEGQSRIKTYREAGRDYPQEILERAANDPEMRLDRVEQAALLHRRIELKNRVATYAEEVVKARARGDMEAVKAANANIDASMDALAMMDLVTKRAGTETARDLAFRRMERHRDFSQVEMELQARARKDGEALTDKERGEIRRIRIERDRALRALEQAELSREQAQATGIDAALAAAKKQPPPPRVKYMEANKLVKKSDIPALSEEFRAKLTGGLKAGLPVDALVPGAKIVLAHLEAGTRSAAQLTKIMVKEFGEAVRPYMKQLLEMARKDYAATAAGNARKALEAGFDEGKSLIDLQRHVDDLVDTHIRGGVDEREALMDAVHADIQEINPKVTRDDVREAFSRYGQQRKLDPDEVKAKIADLKDQVRQTLKLRDMARGDAPLASGWEKRLPSDEARRLKKEVEQAKKELDAPDDSAHIQSALNTEKRRLANEIKDLERQLKSGVKDEPNKRTLKLDAEAKELKKRVAVLRKQFREVFGKKGLTDEQRINAAIKAAERSNKVYEEMLKTGDVTPRKRGREPVTSPELEAARARRDANRERVNEMRLALKPKKTAEEIAMQRAITRWTKTIADREAAMRAGDPELNKRTPVEIKSPSKEYLDVRARYERTDKKWREFLTIKRLENRTFSRRAVDLVLGQPLHLSRAFMTSMDMSALGRQGFVLSLSHPVLAMKAIPEMMKAFVSKRHYERLVQKIETNPKYGQARRAGLFFSDIGTQNLNRMEEEMMGRWVEHIPFVAGSARAYSAYLNKIRMDSFDTLTATMSATGKATAAEQKAIANYINVATGRGGGGKLADQFSVANSILFAPRNMVSRFQLLTGQPFTFNPTNTKAGAVPARARKMIAREYFRTAVGYATMFSLAKMAGAEIETDPTSSDFLKWRWGTTRVDPWAGMQQAAVLMSRLGVNQTKSLRTGETRSLNVQEAESFGMDAWDVITNFGRSKLAPAPGAFFNARSGKNIVGEPSDWISEAKSMGTPLVIQDVIEVAKEHGIPKATAVALIAFFGMGVSDFDPEADK